jgi:hypothetical protein
MKPDASHIAGGLGSGIEGHCAKLDDDVQKNTIIKDTIFKVFLSKGFVIIIEIS